MRWLMLTIVVALVATCGQKGPLQLPDTRTASVSTCAVPAA